MDQESDVKMQELQVICAALLCCLCCACVCVLSCSALVDHGTIDCINILQATMLAMRTAVEGLAGAGLKPDYLLIDGNR